MSEFAPGTPLSERVKREKAKALADVVPFPKASESGTTKLPSDILGEGSHLATVPETEQRAWALGVGADLADYLIYKTGVLLDPEGKHTLPAEVAHKDNYPHDSIDLRNTG